MTGPVLNKPGHSKMPPYKKQYYLPAVYLREFSADRTQLSRTSPVYRYDGVMAHLVSVESQCHGKFFYSKDDAERVERIFCEKERAYDETMGTIKNGKAPMIAWDGSKFGAISA